MPSKDVTDERVAGPPTHYVDDARTAWHGVKRPASTGRLGPDNTEGTSIAAETGTP